MPTFKISTLGCKVNQYETQLIREQLLAVGLSEGSGKSPALVYIINTCTVTQKADATSFSLIRRAIRENPRAKIIVTGCLTELDAGKIRKLFPSIKILKNRRKQDIAGHILGRKKNSKPVRGISYFKGHSRVFLKVQDGCNNRCSYCKVPLVRGSSRSRLPEEIIAEAKNITAAGTKEIVLCGICLGAYGRDLKLATNLTELLGRLEVLPGLKRIRLSSIEAGDISDSLISKIAGSDKICRHLHIPIQSGDNDVLKKMFRRYSRSYYLKLIQKIKKRIPEIAITTDVMVGFPGESQKHFKNTLDLVRQIVPLKVHIFPYSLRLKTPASRLKGQLATREMKSRVRQLEKVSLACAVKYKSRFINKSAEVLVENNYQKRPGLWQGYSSNYLKVIIKSSQKLKNRIVAVRLGALEGDYLKANLC